MSDSELALPRARGWFRHQVGNRTHLGIVDPSKPDQPYLDAGEADELELLAAGALTAEHLERLAADAAQLVEPRWAVPVAHPSKILCLGKNYAAHAAEFGAEVPEEPIFFTKLRDSLLPNGGTIRLPRWVTSRIDHEIELAVVLGFADPSRQGRKYVEPGDAAPLVAGYTILDDVTARRMQGDDRGARRPWLRCKSFDTFCPIGPWVVPAADLPGVADLAIRLWVGGELRQDSRTSRMVVSISEAIAYLSRHTTLRPGDIIAMGTPEGVGPLQPGDRVVGEIEGIGRLVNDVAREE